jgi:hypothetical protein
MQVPAVLLAALLGISSACATAEETKKPSSPRFQSTAAEWSPVNALTLAEAAGFAYNKDAGVEVMKKLGCERFETLTFPVPLPPKFKFEEGEPGPQGFITGGPQHIVIAFRGTEINIVDLLTDAWALPASLSPKIPGKVHGGFAGTFHGLWPDLKTKLEAMRQAYPDAKIWITGHSLGGALAVMAAATLAVEEQQPVQGLITFGAPVTGDAEFHISVKTALGGRSWRCVHELDPVTLDVAALHIPVRMPAAVTRFKHGGTAVYLNDDGTIAANGATAVTCEVLELGLHWMKARKFTRPANVLTRHSIGSGYVPALRKLAASTDSPRPDPR